MRGNYLTRARISTSNELGGDAAKNDCRTPQINHDGNC